MSVNYAVFGLAMAGAGVLTDAIGARAVWLVASGAFFVAAGVAVLSTRWLANVREEHLLEAYADAAAAALERNGSYRPHPEPAPEPVAGGRHPSGLRRIATLLEEIERRRDVEARRP
jgi:hypothetical protein